jgi:hypothetical protein
MDRDVFNGEGEGEARSAIRRSRSRPPGVLARASCGDRGGHGAGTGGAVPFKIVSITKGDKLSL